ncbi:hypothetical protein [Streptomyces lavendulocolor]|uniref:hypothetical protein n=1 Tax=Streptomyces lavendulocolor TaxID=67316 RepID=UPI003C2D9ABE
MLSAFSHLPSKEVGDTHAAARLASAEPRMRADAAERIIVLVTGLRGIDTGPCDGSFALKALGQLPRDRPARPGAGRPEAVDRIGRTVIVFVRQVLTAVPHQDGVHCGEARRASFTR